jgi:hypothetical protein
VPERMKADVGHAKLLRNRRDVVLQHNPGPPGLVPPRRGEEPFTKKRRKAPAFRRGDISRALAAAFCS